MSIHVSLNKEAELRLHTLKRNTTISSLVIAVLVVVLIFIVLGLFLLPNIIKESPTIVTYSATSVEETVAQEKKIQNQVKRMPSAPSSSMVKVIAANSSSPISIPVPEIDVPTPSADFGDGQDFGTGWGGGGFGDGGAGGGGGFGSSNSGSGGLEGYFYALEHSKGSTKSRPKVKRVSDPEYVEILDRMQSAGYPSSIFDDYFRADKVLYLTNLAIPNTVSEQGPKLFGAEHVEGRFWVAHYSGTVTVPESGTYRFSGVGDNYLHVLIDGKPVMHYGTSEPKGWAGQVSTDKNFQSPYTAGWWVRNGKWISLRAGQTIRIDIAIGEAGGGWCGFNLQLEEKNTKYRSAPDGRPILPLFTTAPFSDEEIKALRDTFKSYEFDFDQYLVFPIKR